MTALWVSHQSTLECHGKIQKQLAKTYSWTTKNKLILSTNKTKAMFFSYKNTNPPILEMNESIIEYVSDYKYLGILLDKRLTWKKHIEYLKDKCSKDLRLMKIVSHQGWGADAKWLHRLYSALVLTKLSYGAFLYDSAAKTNLKILDRIQYEGARIITGALKCTNTDLLETASNLMPLAIKRKLDMMQYAGRVLARGNHPN